MHPPSPFWFKPVWQLTHNNCSCQQWLCLDLMMSRTSAVTAGSAVAGGAASADQALAAGA